MNQTKFFRFPFRFQFYSYIFNKNYFRSDNLLQKTNFTNKICYGCHTACKLFLLLLTIKRIILKILRMNLYEYMWYLRKSLCKIIIYHYYISTYYYRAKCNLSRNLFFFLQNYSNVFFLMKYNETNKYERLFNKIYLSIILKFRGKDILKKKKKIDFICNNDSTLNTSDFYF